VPSATAVNMLTPIPDKIPAQRHFFSAYIPKAVTPMMIAKINRVSLINTPSICIPPLS